MCLDNESHLYAAIAHVTRLHLLQIPFVVAVQARKRAVQRWNSVFQGLLAAAHLIIIVIQLPLEGRVLGNMRQVYQIHHSLEMNTLRMLLPAKLDGAAGLNATAAAEVGLEPCFGSSYDATTSLPVDMPLWMLPDDNVGLTELAGSQVRATRVVRIDP